ncbi:putative COBRA-like protein 1 [Cocos nucifera]|uniref:Putative COBRA-like protein 1 n=1 Tax=Cocos nucifera TaxID=13894 RepID=A0A8K0ITQ8_COCNU|nr:putative COBRA-like protein 1 [Cocos nucifera]
MTNFNYCLNYLQTVIVQHPNLNNVTKVIGFNYKPLVPYGSINDTGMFYGMKYYNDLLMEAGPLGNVQSELLLQKDQNIFTLKQGWVFPHKVYFNGDECAIPPPDSNPYLHTSAPVKCSCHAVDVHHFGTPADGTAVVMRVSLVSSYLRLTDTIFGQCR